MRTKILKDRPTLFGGKEKMGGGAIALPPCPMLATGLISKPSKVSRFLNGARLQSRGKSARLGINHWVQLRLAQLHTRTLNQLPEKKWRDAVWSGASTEWAAALW